MDGGGHGISSQAPRTGTGRRVRVGGTCPRRRRFRRWCGQLRAAGGDHRRDVV